jgi:uncharacterized membrane protein YqjE
MNKNEIMTPRHIMQGILLYMILVVVALGIYQGWIIWNESPLVATLIVLAIIGLPFAGWLLDKMTHTGGRR